MGALDRRITRLEEKHAPSDDLADLSDAELALLIRDVLDALQPYGLGADEQTIRELAKDYGLEADTPLAELLPALRSTLTDWASGRVHAYSGWTDGAGRPLGPRGRVPLQPDA